MYPRTARNGLGILPVIVTTAVNLLVPAIESLFKSNSTYSFPETKAMIDNWAGVINLDPTLVTPGAQWAWANVRCVAGDPTAFADVQTAERLFQTAQFGSTLVRITPNGPVPDPPPMTMCGSSPASAAAYALAAVRVLTTAQANNPQGDSLYGGTLPKPLPDIVPQNPNAGSGIPANYLLIGAAAIAVLMLSRR